MLIKAASYQEFVHVLYTRPVFVAISVVLPLNRICNLQIIQGC